MRQVGLVITFSLVFLFAAHSQQKSLISQYRYNQLVLNPAYAGHKNDLTLNLLHRNQWVNLEGAPVTNIASMHVGVKDKNSGVGLTFINETIGVHNDFSLSAAYAYKIKFKTGVLSAGIQGSFNKLNSDFDRLNLQNQSDVVFSTFENRFNPNFGLGLFYSSDKGYVGLASPFIIENRILMTGRGLSEARESRYYFLTGGYLFPVNKDFIFYPSALVRYQQGSPVGFDININTYLQEVLNLGIAYRSSDALSFMCALTVNENFTFGYAYDYTLSNISTYTNDTHELMLIYKINLYKEKCFTYF